MILTRRPASKNPSASGFTLVELLVVIGVIAVLISLLLPALSKARAQARTVACLANLRSVGQAMIMYTSQNHGWIPGSGHTTGRHLWTASGANCVKAQASFNITSNMPLVNEPQDWAGPILRTMGVAVPPDSDPLQRFKFYLETPALRCPSATQVLMTPDSGGNTSLGAQPMFSYLTATAFLTVAHSRYPHPAAGGFIGNVVYLPPPSSSGDFPEPPSGYTPKITKVGITSMKVFAADGAKRSYYQNTTTLRGPQYVLSDDPADTRNQYTVFSDWGAFYGNSQSYHREAVPGNATGTVQRDGRVLAYRHGATAQYSSAGSYRMNAVFYDGHAETLDDFTACDPNFWLPSGAKFWNPTSGTSNSIGGVKVLWSDYQKSKYAGTWGSGSSFIIR